MQVVLRVLKDAVALRVLEETGNSQGTRGYWELSRVPEDAEYTRDRATSN